MFRLFEDVPVVLQRYVKQVSDVKDRVKMNEDLLKLQGMKR